MKQLKHIHPAIILIVSLVALYFFYFNVQPPVSYELDDRFDAHRYLQNVEILNGSKEVTRAPFNTRILHPTLASITLNPINGFGVINILSTIGTCILLFLLWSKLELKPYLIWGGLAWLVLHWSGLLRHYIHEPVNSDTLGYFFYALTAWAIFNRKTWILVVVAPFAMAQKETYLAILMVMLVVEFWHVWKFKQAFLSKTWLSIAIVTSFVTLLSLSHIFPPADGSYHSPIRVLLFHLKEAVLDPFDLVRWAVATFMGFGVFGMALILKSTHLIKTKGAQLHVTAISFLFVFLSIAAGRDMTRILFQGAPFILSAILLLANNYSPRFALAGLLLSIPYMRLFRAIPDGAQEWDNYTTWFPSYAPTSLVLTWLIYSLLCLVVFLIFEKREQLKPLLD